MVVASPTNSWGSCQRFLINDEEIFLEGADGSFGDVTTMDIRGNELELRPPLLLDVELVVCAAFVVKYLEVGIMAVIFEAGHDLICGGETVLVVAGLEWLHQDDIGVQMVGKHE